MKHFNPNFFTKGILILLSCCFIFSIGFSQTGEEWYKKAEDSEDANQKVQYFTKAIQAGKNDNWAYYYRAWAYYDLSHFEHALEDFKRAEEAEGSLDLAFVHDGFAWTYYHLEEYTVGMKYAKQAQKERPAVADVWNISGWIHIGMKQYAEAVDCYTQYINIKPQSSFGYQNRSYVNQLLKNYEAVLSDCNKWLLIDAKSEKALIRKANALIKLGRKQEGVNLIENMMEYDHNDPVSLMELGQIFHKHGDYATAVEFFVEAIAAFHRKNRSDPNYARSHKDELYNIYMAKGKAHYRLKSYSHGLQEYQNAANLLPAKYEAWYEIGELQTFHNNYSEAIHSYEKAFRIRPELTTGWVNLGYCYSNMGEERKAISAYSRGINADPENGLLYNNRGYSYLEMGDLDKAYADMLKAVEVEPEIVMSHVSLAEYYYMTNEYAKAIAKFSIALEMPGGSVKAYKAAHYTRGLCYYVDKEWRMAKTDFQQAIDLDSRYALAYEKRGICEYELKELCPAYKSLKRALNLEKNLRERKALLAPKYLAKITINPCK